MVVEAAFEVGLQLGAREVNAFSDPGIEGSNSQDLSVAVAALVSGAFIIVLAVLDVLGGAIAVDTPLGGTLPSTVAVGSGLLGVYRGALGGGITELAQDATVTEGAFCITNTISGGLQCLALKCITRGAQSTGLGRNACLAISNYGMDTKTQNKTN